MKYDTLNTKLNFRTDFLWCGADVVGGIFNTMQVQARRVEMYTQAHPYTHNIYSKFFAQSPPLDFSYLIHVLSVPEQLSLLLFRFKLIIKLQNKNALKITEN